VPDEPIDREAVVAALEPFARLGMILDKLPSGRLDDSQPLREVMPGGWPTVGDARRALALWLQLHPEEE
jgi:hypothetical protein